MTACSAEEGRWTNCQPAYPDTGVFTTYGYDAADRLLLRSPSNGSPTAFTFDQNGNMVGDSWLGNVGTYGWDTEDRLLRIVHANGAIETNTYYAHGLRESYTGPGASGRDRFIYDGVNVLLEKLPGGTFAIYTQQPETPGGLYSGRANGASSYQVPDHAGHVRQLTDANGAVTDGSVIDAWGYERYHLGTSYDPYRGFGEYGYRQEDGKRLYTQARHLRVDQGRWMSVDPVETEPPYLYVGDRPTWRVDPSGEQSGDWLREAGRSAADLVRQTQQRWSEQAAAARAWLGHQERQAESAAATLVRLVEGAPEEALNSARDAFVTPEWSAYGATLRDLWRRGAFNPFAFEGHIEKGFDALEEPWRLAFESGSDDPGSALLRTGLSQVTPNQWRSLGRGMRASLTALLPPLDDPRSLFAYQGGFAFGVMKASVWSIIGLPFDALKIVQYLAELKGDILAAVLDMAKQAFHSIVAKFGKLPGLLPYDRGKFVGSLVVAAIGLVLAGRTIAGHVAKAVREWAQARGLTGKGVSLGIQFEQDRALLAYNARTSEDVARSVMAGIRRELLSEDARFGPGVYVAERPGTAVLEVNYKALVKGTPRASHVIRYRLHREWGRTLDLTDPRLMRKYGYDPKSVLPPGVEDRYRATRPVAAKARRDGYDIIMYKSQRGQGSNYVVIDHFDEVLEPLGLTGVRP